MINQKVAVVIGGTAPDGKDSIGAAICHFLKDNNVLPLPVSSNLDKVKATLHALDLPQALTNILTVDVTDTEALAQLFSTIKERYQAIDIVVNAQGIAIKKPTIEMSVKDWQSIIDVNLLSVAMACQFAAKIMIEQQKGHIINIASGTALRGYAQVAAYGTTKGAICTLTQHLASEWAQYGLSVNALVPGYFVTAMNRDIFAKMPERLEQIAQQTPARRIGDSAFEDLRAAITYLTTCTSFVNGQIIAVDGGFCMSS